jgi:hypothetical protein
MDFQVGADAHFGERTVASQASRPNLWISVICLGAAGIFVAGG